MSQQQLLRSGAVASFAAAVLLVVQFLIVALNGDLLMALGGTMDPTRVTELIQEYASELRLLMAADDAFAIAYAIAFILLAYYLMARIRWLAILALVFSLLTALSDLAENSLTLGVVELVSANQPLEAGTLLLLFWLGQMKYLAIYVAAILFALGVWGRGRLAGTLVVLLLAFAIIGVASIAAQGQALVLMGVVKIGLMVALLVVGGLFLWRAASSVP